MSAPKVKKAQDKPPTKDKFPAEVDMGVIDEAIGYHIRLANVSVYKKFQELIAMTPRQYSILGLIAHNEGLPQVALGRALNMDKATTMVIIDKLDDAGLVERKTSTVDRRYQAIYLTRKGKKKQRDSEKKVQAHEDYLTSKFTKAELNNFMDYLSRCTVD